VRLGDDSADSKANHHATAASTSCQASLWQSEVRSSARRTLECDLRGCRLGSERKEKGRITGCIDVDYGYIHTPVTSDVACLLFRTSGKCGCMRMVIHAKKDGVFFSVGLFTTRRAV
jgi:hypothetical protein